MIVTPNLDGHQPSVRTTPAGKTQDDALNLELYAAKPNLDIFRTLISDAQGEASRYERRVTNAMDYWHSRWDGQTVDGLKWHSAGQSMPWPWEGASDTRTHIIDKIVGQHVTIDSFALRSMKMQAQSTRPAATVRDSQNATILLNWMVGTHMQMQAHRETRLAINWKNATGAAVIAVDWEQERRIDYVHVSLMTLEALTTAQGMAGQAALLQDLQGATLSDWQALIADESNEDALIPFIQKFSPIVTKAQARKIIKDLRELRFAEVPIPYVFKSQPRWRALKPMQDVFFEATADDLNINPRWVAEPEYLTETELTDRIETANYDPGFVSDALEHKGKTGGSWTSRTDLAGNPMDNDQDERVEIWRIKYRALDRGTPVLFDTVFHMDVEDAGLHGPCKYSHGNFGYHALRFEYHDRPILSSRGIAEIAYTWQNEIKAQRDGRTDRVALTLRPPMLANHRDVLKIKAAFSPGVIFPELRKGDMTFMQPPQWDPGSVEIEKTTMAAINEHFGLFGMEVDPALKQQRQQERADDLLIQFKPIVNQTYQLTQDYLPDAEVAAVVGPLSRPFHMSRDEIQGQYQITLTVDMKKLDPEQLQTIMNAAVQVVSLDTTGVIDRSKLVKFIMESISVQLAEETVQEQEPVTEKEIADERKAIREIIGSGMDVELPMGANYQLRLQTLQSVLQEASQNPATTKIIQNNPDIMKVLQNRQQFLQRQLQQQQNSQIGRMQVSQTFSKNAPQAAEPMGMQQ